MENSFKNRLAFEALFIGKYILKLLIFIKEVFIPRFDYDKKK